MMPKVERELLILSLKKVKIMELMELSLRPLEIQKTIAHRGL